MQGMIAKSLSNSSNRIDGRGITESSSPSTRLPTVRLLINLNPSCPYTSRPLSGYPVISPTRREIKKGLTNGFVHIILPITCLLSFCCSHTGPGHDIRKKGLILMLTPQCMALSPTVWLTPEIQGYCVQKKLQESRLARRRKEQQIVVRETA